jgi:mRNA interferase HigB
MRIVATKVLRDFWERHPGAKQHLEAWVDEARKADWRQPADIKVQFRSASILKNRRVVFNISGSTYRLIVAVAYRYGALYIKFISTHAEYGAIDAKTIETEL